MIVCYTYASLLYSSTISSPPHLLPSKTMIISTIRYGCCGSPSSCVTTPEPLAKFISTAHGTSGASLPQSVKTGKTEKSSKTSSTGQDFSFSDNSNEDGYNESNNSNEDGCHDSHTEKNIEDLQSDLVPLRLQKIKSIECGSAESNSSPKNIVEEESVPAIPLQIMLPTSDDVDNFHSNSQTIFKRSKIHQQRLRDFEIKNNAIMIKRREEIARARERYQSGTSSSRKRDLAPSEGSLAESKDENESTNCGVMLSSSQLSASSETVVSASRSQSSSKTLPRKLHEIEKRSLSAAAKDKIIFSDNISISTTSTHRSTKSLRELSQRNMQFGLKRKEQIAKARAAAKCGSDGRLSIVAPRIERRKLNRSSGSSRSLQSLNSRLDNMYEKGKQKIRSELSQSQRDKLSSRSNSAIPQKRMTRDLEELKRRDLQISMKRRENIAKARAASKSKRELPARRGTFTPQRRRKPISFRERK